ncbi:hypothetical protein GCM10011581_42950 [Saccharopolyspora subtropica]|uniref:Uncharacterized protein n=1 Tax=Saccharopolyspora thermophila TaxID=89367 RepID=A0A917K6T4_9PSEU|nr:hypothetical protein GCM10011581_42950 [Saccharopolyspora subtropica]
MRRTWTPPGDKQPNLGKPGNPLPRSGGAGASPQRHPSFAARQRGGQVTAALFRPVAFGSFHMAGTGEVPVSEFAAAT